MYSDLNTTNNNLSNGLYGTTQDTTLDHLMVDRKVKSEIDELEKLVADASKKASSEHFSTIDTKLGTARKELELLAKMRAEVLKMKHGSIALVSQITTVSKIRIYDPKTDHDILSGIKLSNEKLDLIDYEIRKSFTNF